MKDYSHIKQGMYVLTKDIKDRETYEKVQEAFYNVGACGRCYYCNKSYRQLKEYPDELYYGWDRVGDLFAHAFLDRYGSDAQQVSIDFLLNGPEEQETISKTTEPTAEECIARLKELGYTVELKITLKGE